jgi:hypothetical protein
VKRRHYTARHPDGRAPIAVDCYAETATSGAGYLRTRVPSLAGFTITPSTRQTDAEIVYSTHPICPICGQPAAPGNADGECNRCASRDT